MPASQAGTQVHLFRAESVACQLDSALFKRRLFSRSVLLLPRRRLFWLELVWLVDVACRQWCRRGVVRLLRVRPRGVLRGIGARGCSRGVVRRIWLRR